MCHNQPKKVKILCDEKNDSRSMNFFVLCKNYKLKAIFYDLKLVLKLPRFVDFSFSHFKEIEPQEEENKIV